MRRVLLVEDDASIQRFVEIALEDSPAELMLAGTLAEARAMLQQGPVALLITDLMLPDGHGTELLRELQAQPALRAGAALAVFSAGVSAARREELLALDVTRVLEKPVSVNALLACVEEALASAPPGAAGAAAHACTTPAALAGAAPGVAMQADEAGAIAEHFGGKDTLFDAFKATSEPQLALDLRDGDVAAGRGDAVALRLTAHNLKTVLRLLGYREASRLAQAVERAAADGAAPPALQSAWAALREGLGPR